MFTGIIETLGHIVELYTEEQNLHLVVESSISAELKIDQSIAHNGVCLTVIDKHINRHTVTAIQETLLKSNLSQLNVGDLVNLERCLLANSRIDGHFVQGHVDQTAICIAIAATGGSWQYIFQYTPNIDNILVKKGSICVDGVSLTLVNVEKDTFSVAIIPYTHQHTVFGQYKIGSVVNIEFDIVGKYQTALFNRQQSNLQ